MGRGIDPDLPQDDKDNHFKVKRKAIFLALRIWARQKWSFEWIMKKLPLTRQAQFFQAYRSIYEREEKADLNNINALSDHHIMSILFQLRWEVQVGLERHFVRKPPGPVVATGSTGHYQTKAGSLPISWNEQVELYEQMGNKGEG